MSVKLYALNIYNLKVPTMHQQSWDKRLHAGWEEGQARELDTESQYHENPYKSW